MQLMTDVTTKWMQHMVEQKFPPLTPHHTQAFTVLMMTRFFETYIAADREQDQTAKKHKLKPKAFIAQLSTGEGKSIVIAMLAIFMVQRYQMKVPVLATDKLITMLHSFPMYDALLV